MSDYGDLIAEARALVEGEPHMCTCSHQMGGQPGLEGCSGPFDDACRFEAMLRRLMADGSPDPRVALEFVRAERDALQAQLDAIRGMEPGDEYLRCEDCGKAFSIETTPAGEFCSDCDGELRVIRAMEVRNDEGLRMMLGGDAGEQDARAAVLGRSIVSVEHDLHEDGEMLALFFDGDDVLVMECVPDRPGVLTHRMAKARAFRIAQTAVRMIRSNPVAPDGSAFFTSGPADHRELHDRLTEHFEKEPPAMTVDRFGGTYSMTWRALPWWHWRSLLRRVQGGGWAELAATAARRGPVLPATMFEVVEDPYLPLEQWVIASPPDAWSVAQREEFVAAARREWEKERGPLDELRVAAQQDVYAQVYRDLLALVPLVVPAREDMGADYKCRQSGRHESWEEEPRVWRCLDCRRPLPDGAPRAYGGEAL